MSETQHTGLPVSGYRPQSEAAVALVNRFKRKEEELLRDLDAMKGDDSVDQRWLATGRTQLEKAFMSINRSVFKPGRVSLPEDAAPAQHPGTPVPQSAFDEVAPKT